MCKLHLLALSEFAAFSDEPAAGVGQICGKDSRLVQVERMRSKDN